MDPSSPTTYILLRYDTCVFIRCFYWGFGMAWTPSMFVWSFFQMTMSHLLCLKAHTRLPCHSPMIALSSRQGAAYNQYQISTGISYRGMQPFNIKVYWFRVMFIGSGSDNQQQTSLYNSEKCEKSEKLKKMQKSAKNLSRKAMRLRMAFAFVSSFWGSSL